MEPIFLSPQRTRRASIRFIQISDLPSLAMPAPRTLDLTPEQTQELEHARDHHPKPYLREKAAALLKVAHGHSARWVARYGLLKPRDTGTVYNWLNRYEADGIDGLLIRPGRGRPPAFSPSP